MPIQLRNEIRDVLQRGRTLIDRMKIDARLLRADLRDKKDETVRELESAYEDLSDRMQSLRDDSAGVADAVKTAAVTARDTFKRKLAEVRAPESADAS
jgi:hypothetical protein